MPWAPNDINAVLCYVNKHEFPPCWIWQGAKLNNGYGKVTINYATKLVHRYIYEQLVGPIPEGLQLDHSCRNKLCVNPKHLEPVTCKENMARRYALMTHCKQGHPLSGDNLYVTPNGRRNCKACRKQAAIRFRG